MRIRYYDYPSDDDELLNCYLLLGRRSKGGRVDETTMYV